MAGKIILMQGQRHNNLIAQIRIGGTNKPVNSWAVFSSSTRAWSLSNVNCRKKKILRWQFLKVWRLPPNIRKYPNLRTGNRQCLRANRGRKTQFRFWAPNFPFPTAKRKFAFGILPCPKFMPIFCLEPTPVQSKSHRLGPGLISPPAQFIDKRGLTAGRSVGHRIPPIFYKTNLPLS